MCSYIKSYIKRCFFSNGPPLLIHKTLKNIYEVY